MFTSENNWYRWYYGDSKDCIRQTGELKFNTEFGKCRDSVGTFKEELVKAATSTLDHRTGKLVILFSGGADSEVMLRAFLEVGANPEVVICRFENDYNIYDVSYAVTVCSLLNVPYKIVDLNLTKFYETDAERISELSQIDRPRALPYCKILELVDGFPVMGNGDLTLVRRQGIDYTVQGEWDVRCWEHDIGWNKFLCKINRPGIAEWFKWTPGLVVSFMQLQWFQKLTTDGFYKKAGADSTKLIGYREAYPNLLDRKKQTGFECIMDLSNEFEEFLIKKNNGLKFRNIVDRTIPQLFNELGVNY